MDMKIDAQANVFEWNVEKLKTLIKHYEDSKYMIAGINALIESPKSKADKLVFIDIHGNQGPELNMDAILVLKNHYTNAMNAAREEIERMLKDEER